VEEKGYILTNHAKDRMRERGVLARHVRECLLKGEIDDEIFLNAHNDWQVNLTKIVAGSRVKITATLNTQSRVVVITVMRN